MWNPSAFIKWQYYCKHYDHIQRLNAVCDVIRLTLNDIPAAAFDQEYVVDYERCFKLQG